jgi:hypothetical protein
MLPPIRTLKAMLAKIKSIRQVVLVHIDRRWFATPGASEWVSCVSSPATNRSGRTPEKGVENLVNSPAAFQISLTIR